MRNGSGGKGLNSVLEAKAFSVNSDMFTWLEAIMPQQLRHGSTQI